MPQFHFEPTARLQRFLGRELIADPNLAIVEFVKNAYDAGASEVHVEFRLAGSLDAHEITISDNGVGMDVGAFEENWMHPGFSYKVRPGGATEAPTTPAGTRQRSRVPAGEKGLGRLAAGRLGERLDVYTRTKVVDQWLHVMFDWAAFDRMDIPMREVAVDYEVGPEPPNSRLTAGTVIQIRSPYFDWSHRVRGRKVPGRADTRLGRLRQDLGLLMEPFAHGGDEFRIYLGVDRADLVTPGLITSDEPTVRDYVWDFELSAEGDSVRVRRSIRRARRIAAKTGLPEATEVDELRSLEEGDGDDLAHLRSGPIKGAFYYSPPQVAQRGETLGRAPGVYLYRDGIRVEPYGSPGDDWIGVQARKASRQGYAAIQPNQLTGYVEISRHANAELIDMSNRNGLVENEAYDDLVAQLRAEFRAFDDLVLEELVRPNWVEPTERTQLAAQRAQAFAAALSRAATHSMRQPVAALGGELEVLRAIANKVEDPATKSALEGVIRRSRAHLRDIDESLHRLMSVQDIDLAQVLSEIDTVDVVKAAVERIRPFAEAVDVPLNVVPSQPVFVVSEATALTEAVAELVRNAVQATRASDRHSSVSISVRRDERWVEIVVSDEAGGVASSIRDRLFEESVSLSGQTGFGLLSTQELLALVNARVELRSSSSVGSVFVVIVPSAAGVRKEG